VKRQSEVFQPLPEFDQHPPCIRLELKAHYEVIAVSHDDDPPAGVPLPPAVGP
jgi:hypothetical protein